MLRFSVNRARTKWKWTKERWNIWKIFQNTLSRGLELKKRGEEKGKLVWEKFGMISGRPKSARLHRSGHNSLHRRNFDARLVPLESFLPGLHCSLNILLRTSPGGEDIVGWNPFGPNLRDFTKTGITFCTGGILMLGLWHWKANFKGFMDAQLWGLNLLTPGRPTRPSGRPTT